LASRETELGELAKRAEDPNIWQDPQAAQKLHTELARRRRELAPMRELLSQAEDLVTLAELAEAEGSEAEAAEIEQGLAQADRALAELEVARLFAGEYDTHNAIIHVNAGAGGTEACDWVDMLARMYGRWAERHRYALEMIDRTPGDEAGSRSVTFSISGDHAYGRLRGERGVHRLVRISPFDSANRRHTSFASVDVIPEVEEADEVQINPDDLKIETYRASSAGGQHVNKTDSAVRMTHLPTGIVASCQNERSQHKNRAFALRVLQARLLDLQRQEQEKKMAELRGVQTDIAWGHQIRSYVLHPYQMVKDHRTEQETGSASLVLDGEMDEFIEAFLRYDMERRAKSGAR
jgi:peptide chain release factor 2